MKTINIRLKDEEKILKSVIYKGIECEVFFNYSNGYIEILCVDEIILINMNDTDQQIYW